MRNILPTYKHKSKMRFSQSVSFLRDSERESCCAVIPARACGGQPQALPAPTWDLVIITLYRILIMICLNSWLSIAKAIKRPAFDLNSLIFLKF